MRNVVIAFSIFSLFCVVTGGCSQHETSTSKEEVKTPGGTTTVTVKKDVEKTGDHKDK